MTISELISDLHHIWALHGDIEITRLDGRPLSVVDIVEPGIPGTDVKDKLIVRERLARK